MPETDIARLRHVTRMMTPTGMDGEDIHGWEYTVDDDGVVAPDGDHVARGFGVAAHGVSGESRAAFIAACMTHVPSLLTELESLRAVRDAAEMIVQYDPDMVPDTTGVGISLLLDHAVALHEALSRAKEAIRE